MVEVILGLASDHLSYGGGCPRVEIHTIERHVHGNSVVVKVYGELKIASGERVYARELGLNTLQVLLLTPEASTPLRLSAKKYVYHKGEYDNWASIDIWDYTGSLKTAGNGPDDGSVWLDFIGLGE
jgi:hypothetical protein